MTKSTPQSREKMRARTKLVHAGRDPSEQFGFVNTPIYRGSTVLQPTLAALEQRHGKRFFYGTHGTPTTEALEAAWTEIAGAAGTVLTPSGLAAISVALLTALTPPRPKVCASVAAHCRRMRSSISGASAR